MSNKKTYQKTKYNEIILPPKIEILDCSKIKEALNSGRSDKISHENEMTISCPKEYLAIMKQGSDFVVAALQKLYKKK
jgi:hypothetical protein